MYASIGWSVNATLGYAQAMPNKRVIACIGDGSFQVLEFMSKTCSKLIKYFEQYLYEQVHGPHLGLPWLFFLDF